MEDGQRQAASPSCRAGSCLCISLLGIVGVQNKPPQYVVSIETQEKLLPLPYLEEFEFGAMSMVRDYQR